MRRLILLALFALPAVPTLGLEYSDTFFGINFEGNVAVATDSGLSLGERSEFTRLSGVFTVGTRRTFPFRLRSGLGWWPEHSLALMAGTEIALFERLNRAQARMFGVYLLGDAILLAQDGIDYDLRASLMLQVPVTLAGGVSLGAGINRHGNLLVRVCTSIGAYPILPD